MGGAPSHAKRLPMDPPSLSDWQSLMIQTLMISQESWRLLNPVPKKHADWSKSTRTSKLYPSSTCSKNSTPILEHSHFFLSEFPFSRKSFSWGLSPTPSPTRCKICVASSLQLIIALCVERASNTCPLPAQVTFSLFPKILNNWCVEQCWIKVNNWCAEKCWIEHWITGVQNDAE